MSNVIPIVSSSPPPFDDDGGWDDDDEDFGNFASAPSGVTDDEPDQNHNDAFEVDWSNPDASHSTEAWQDEKGVTKAPFSGLADGLSMCAASSKQNPSDPQDQPNHNRASDESETVPHHENEDWGKFPVNFDHPSSKDIPPSASTDTCMSLETKVPKPEGQETSDTMTQSKENLVLTSTKINEWMVSTTSTADSGVFSSDLSPLSHQETLSALQESCNLGALGTTSQASVCTDSSSCADISVVKGSDQHSIVTQVCEDSSDIPQGSFSDKDDKDEDWGDFNDVLAHQENNSSQNEHSSFASFENSAHSDGMSDTLQAERSGLSTVGVKANVSEDLGHIGCENSEKNLSPEETHSEEHANPADSASSSLDRPVLGGSAMQDLDPERDGCIKDPELFEQSNSTGSSEHVFAGESKCAVSASDDDQMVESSCTQGSSPKSAEGTSHNTDFGKKVVEGDSPHKYDGGTQEEKSEIDLTASERGNNIGCAEEGKGLQVTENTDELSPDRVDAGFGCQDDKEFGDFSVVDQEQKSDLSKEVSPITFRTSECEDDASDDGKDKPPAFDADDDDFGEFGDSNSTPVASASDNIEDFGNFNSTPVASASDNVDDFGDFNSTQVASLADNSDDFGDFDSGPVNKPSDIPVSQAGWNNSDGDDFGDFGDAGSSGDQGSGWADFGGSSTWPEQSDSEPHTSKDLPASVTLADQGKKKVAIAVEKCFPVPVDVLHKLKPTAGDRKSVEPAHTDAIADAEAEDTTQLGDMTALDMVVELGLANPLEAGQQTWTVVEHPAKKDPRVRVWRQMKDVDSSHALGYTWPTSHCSQEVFCTLHIDTQNILFTQKKQAVPFFASGLGILEPTRGGNTDAKKDKSAQGAPLKPTLLDTSSKQAPVPATQDIPPVDFDWSVSGLTNPLTANTLDLDFLVVQGSDSCEKTSDEWDWVFKSDAEGVTSTRSGLQPLEEMLKKSTPTAKLATQEVLSPEAEKILAKMPDLSFMQSKVLMFPVKQ